MRKKLLLLLAALAVAIIPGRTTSALSVSYDHLGKLDAYAAHAFTMPTHPVDSYVFGMPTHPVDSYAFGMPTHPVDSYVFGMPTHPIDSYAFGMPTHPIDSYAFGMPTHPVNTYAFGMPTHPINSYVFGMPTHPISGNVEIGKTGLRIVMLPLGAETGRHIRTDSSGFEKSAKDLESNKTKVSNPLAMLPLGRESGRHIRTEDVRDVDADADKHQSANPVTELNGYFGNSYAMLPLGQETGRHVRSLNEEDNKTEESVAAGEPKARA